VDVGIAIVAVAAAQQARVAVAVEIEQRAPHGERLADEARARDARLARRLGGAHAQQDGRGEDERPPCRHHRPARARGAGAPREPHEREREAADGGPRRRCPPKGAKRRLSDQLRATAAAATAP
jgi:hypothetical protein